MQSKKVTLDEVRGVLPLLAFFSRAGLLTGGQIWPDLERGVGVLINDLDKQGGDVGMTSKEFMGLYTNVYDFCVSTNKVRVARGGEKPPQNGRVCGQQKRGISKFFFLLRQAPLARTGAAAGGKLSGANFMGEELYMKLTAFLQTHMGVLRKGAEGLMDESLLLYYHKEWQRFTAALRYVNHIFSYLNRHWIKREAEDGKREVYEVNVLGLVVWRDHLFAEVKGRVTKALLDQIERDRNGEQINAPLVAGVIEGYVRLGLNRERPKEVTLDVYKEEFEVACLAATQDYYTQESGLFIAENSVSDYLKKVITRLAQEGRRGAVFLHPSSEPLLTQVCERVMIEKHVAVIQNEAAAFFSSDKVEDLGALFSLLARVAGGLDPVRVLCEKHIHAVGLAELETVAKDREKDQAVKPQAFVEAVLRVWRKYAEVVRVAFQNDSGFVASLDKASRRFLNSNAVAGDESSAPGSSVAGSSSKAPELLARYCDQLLKKGTKGVTDAEVEKTLDDVLVVFKYIDEKDIFLHYFSKMMAKRLINETSASEDLEGSMISKLKSVSGYEYTTKLQRMILDVATSRDLTQRFGAVPGLDLSVLVLATGSWPLQMPSCEFALPQQLLDVQTRFEVFYGEQHQGRKLVWLPTYSKGELKTFYTSKPYTLQCSTYQMGVLLSFEDMPRLTLEQISIASKLKDAPLRQTLYALVKTRTLTMDPPPESSSEPVIPEGGVSFALNIKFTSKRLKVNINVSSTASVKKEAKDNTQEIDEDRKMAIQACIVRIMKARKSMQHAQLISEVVAQLSHRFKPKIPLIKVSDFSGYSCLLNMFCFRCSALSIC